MKIRKQHKKTVFAWGTFDLLHAGHIEYLKKARALGDYLVVAVLSDAVVARLHGKTRPFVPQKERMEVLSSFAMVDRVMLLTKRSPIQMIEKIKPDMIIGCDLTNDSEWTTNLIQKIRATCPAKKSFSDKQ
ncbi:MAG: adenylyltransferase/cytidyltransferase family protein [Nitrospirae bacterium]|nr:adenylyltransferase/cytidyltransferase family protein [Candidatus Troglogloeales bacterium]MBI3598958.1 adenylyltransferase/cytidyltransferase family protein [Candidatus Troglogloeales bacterium]